MATTTEPKQVNKTRAFATELAALMERHKVFLHTDKTGYVWACHVDGDELLLGNNSITAGGVLKVLSGRING